MRLHNLKVACLDADKHIGRWNTCPGHGLDSLPVDSCLEVHAGSSAQFPPFYGTDVQCKLLCQVGGQCSNGVCFKASSAIAGASRHTPSIWCATAGHYLAEAVATDEVTGIT